ncbi:MAG TPA: substrate-binding and VWA domain-containing protein [Dermatophilaceae bacterium]|nr:substrate-binding and VWA domain-containing protein [Dermatophilaceae bacterium]
MSGRHSHVDPVQRRQRALIGVGAAVAAVALAGTIAVVGTGGEEPEAACGPEVTVRVAAAPAIAPTVREIVAADGGAALGRCATATITAVAATELADADLSTDSPALWVPDSAVRVDQLAARSPGGAVRTLGVLASSPLVVAGNPEAVARMTGSPTGETAEVSWKRVLAGGTPVAVADPETTTEGLSAITTLQTLSGTPAGTAPPLTLVRSFVGLSRAVVPTAETAKVLTSASADGPVMLTTEQAVLAHNREAGAARVVAAYPAEGTTLLEYPVARVRRPQEPAGTDDAAGRLARLLLGPAAAGTVQRAGFRGADGSPPAGPDGGGTRLPSPTRLPEPSPELAEDALRTWSAVTLESRMLTVIDVSGSMKDDGGNGRTRVELARDAARQALAIYPDSAEIGLWAFSVRQTPGTDWVPLVDLGPVGGEVGGVSRRALLQRAATALPSRVKGGTGLYDTTLAAFRAVRNSYEPGRVNAVVLLTDGRNEDDPEGIDLPTLLRTLRTEFERSQPVPIITVGMGPEADMATLRRISVLTGGKAYRALDPQDIETVFLDAMVQRRCRPTCD